MSDAYLVQCFNCLSDYDALEAIWCSCNPQHPTKVCPFCMGCFCAAGQQFKEAFWHGAPETLNEEVETLSRSRMLIGEMLVRSGLITTSQLLEALKRQKAGGQRLGEILVESGALPLDRLEKFLQSQHTAVAVDMSRARIDAMMLKRLGVDDCIREKILPLEAEAFRDRHIMTLVMADPSNTQSIDRVMQTVGYQIIPGVAPAEAIVAAIRTIFPQGSATHDAPARAADVAAPQEAASLKILARAVSRRASHVQVQNHGGVLKVFYRIDGTLYLDKTRAASEAKDAMQSLKTMARIEGESRTVPRAGRAIVEIDGVERAIIVRTRPGREGEELSVKLLDPMTFPPRLDDLGFPAGVVERLRRALENDAGLIIVSAPPLSGATSTIHALASEVLGQGRRLALLESPRAVRFSDVIQEEFFPEIRGSMTEALARAVAGKPRVLAITSSERMSWKGAAAELAGRMLVVCKVEALTLPDALSRLAADGYPPDALWVRPTLVLHQRLLRRPCQTCRTEASTAEAYASALGLSQAEARRLKVLRGAGCDDCAPTPGLRGRTPLTQTLAISPAIAAAVAGGSTEDVSAACRAAGVTSLLKEALAALEAGRTTPEEIVRKQLG